MNKIIVKIKNNKIISNISWMLLGRIIYMALNFIVSLLSARYLGPSNFGLIGYASAYTTFFSSICTLGINSIIVKEFIDYRNKEGEIIGTTLFLKFVSSFCSLITINCLCFVIDKNEFVTKIVVFIYSLSVIFQIFDTFKYWFQSKLQSKYCEITTTIAYIIMALYKVILLITGKSVEWFAISNTIEYIIVAIILYYIYKKKGGNRLKISFEYGRKLLNKSYHFIISGLMVAIYNSTDKFMLKQMLDHSSVAYYTTATTLASLVSFVLIAIIDSFTPEILEAYKNDMSKYKKRNIQLYSLVFYISVIVSFGICILSPTIIKILYGDKYAGAINPLRILTWYTGFSYLGVARNAWIISENKQNYLKYIYISCAIINIVLNYILIPYYSASGAALASLITQISTTIVIPFFIKGLRPNVKLLFDGIFLKEFKIRKKEKINE